MAEYTLESEVQRIFNSVRQNNPELSQSLRVKRAWNSTVDKRIAKHVTAVFVIPNTNASEIIVYVDDSIWATELNLQAEILRLNMNIHLHNNDYSKQHEDNPEQVKKLIFKVSKDKYISKENRLSTRERIEQETSRYRNAQPVSLSEEEEADLNKAFSRIDNDAIREAAYAAARANLEWHKGIDKISA